MFDKTIKSFRNTRRLLVSVGGHKMKCVSNRYVEHGALINNLHSLPLCQEKNWSEILFLITEIGVGGKLPSFSCSCFQTPITCEKRDLILFQGISFFHPLQIAFQRVLHRPRN